MARRSKVPTFPADQRRNWGYWDGRACKANGKLPEWAQAFGQSHPFDAIYGIAFWAGFRGQPHPNTGETPE
jgi:hypothetical protein